MLQTNSYNLGKVVHNYYYLFFISYFLLKAFSITNTDCTMSSVNFRCYGHNLGFVSSKLMYHLEEWDPRYEFWYFLWEWFLQEVLWTVTRGLTIIQKQVKIGRMTVCVSQWVTTWKIDISFFNIICWADQKFQFFHWLT